MHLLQRHPIPVTAWLRRSLVLTYALPRDVLDPLLPPGLTLDTYEGHGMLAIGLVQTEHLRPSILPAVCGRDFFLAGYRIFTRLATSAASLRGLRILRSDTDSPLMVRAGNLLTHYHYRLCRFHLDAEGAAERWQIRTPRQEADLDVTVHLADEPAPLPAGSPFPNEKDARRFAGPLPYTFDYEPETHSIVSIRGLRSNWNPLPVRVDVSRNTFLDREPFRGTQPILANAFYLRDVPYQWLRGVRIPLERSAA